MASLQRVAEFTREFLKEHCSRLEEKREGDKYLFFCGNYLIGSTVKIDEDKVATTVYAPKMGDPIIKAFREAVRKEFNGEVLEQDVKMSGALNENFYYLYNWIKLTD
ncbi:hypothetical protein [Aquifex sp.]